jgi:uncharacterized membrane protein HdeD (DUF308 family)
MTGRMVAGGLACLIGIVWVLQGLNIRKGDGMSGHGEWTFFGALLVFFGAALLVGALRSRRGDD